MREMHPPLSKILLSEMIRDQAHANVGVSFRLAWFVVGMCLSVPVVVWLHG